MNLYFHNNVSSDLNTSDNWYEDSGYSTPHNAIPISSDAGIIQSGENATCDGGSIDYPLQASNGCSLTFQMGSTGLTAMLYINSGASVAISTGTLIIGSGGNIDLMAQLTIESGGTLTFESGSSIVSSSNATIAAGGDITISSGASITVPQFVTINMSSGADLTVVGTLTIQGNLFANAVNALNIFGTLIIETTGVFTNSGNNALNINGELQLKNSQNLTGDVIIASEGGATIYSGAVINFIATQFEVQDNAYLIIENTGNLVMYSGSTLYIHESATFTIHNGGVLNCADGSTFANGITTFVIAGQIQMATDHTISGAQTWQVSSGGVLTIKETGNFNVSGVLLIDDGGYYITEELAIVTHATSFTLQGNMELYSSISTSESNWTLDTTANLLIGSTGHLSVGSVFFISNGAEFNINENGILHLNSSATFTQENTLWSIYGIIEIENNESIDYSYTWTLQSTGELRLQTNGELHVQGALENTTDSIITIDDGSSLYLEGTTTLTNNGIIDCNSYIYVTNQSTLSNQSTLNINETGYVGVVNTALFISATNLTIVGSLTLNQESGAPSVNCSTSWVIDPEGVINISSYSALYVIGGSLSNYGLIHIGPSGGGFLTIASGNNVVNQVGGILTIGTNATFDVRTGSTFNNAGTLNHGDSGALKMEGGGTFTGEGTWNRAAGNFDVSDMTAGTFVTFPEGGTPVYSFGGGGIF